MFLTASYGGVPGAIASVLLTALAAAIAVASLSALSRRRPARWHATAIARNR